MTSSEVATIRQEFSKVLRDNPREVLRATRDQGGHVVLNADDLFKRWPEYAQSPTSRRWLGPILYPAAREFTDWAFSELLNRTPATGTNVVFTAGGGASGKSTVLRAQANRPEVDFIVDTTLSDPDRAFRQIDAVLNTGRQVEVNYVFREFGEAIRGMLGRALNLRVGRIVPVDDMARTHAGAQETVFAILERYEDDDRVAVRLWESLPGNEVKRLIFEDLVARILPGVDELQKQGQTILDECFEEANRSPTGQWKGLSGDRPFYETARSKAQESLRHPRCIASQGHAEGGEGSQAARRSARGDPPG